MTIRDIPGVIISPSLRLALYVFTKYRIFTEQICVLLPFSSMCNYGLWCYHMLARFRCFHNSDSITWLLFCGSWNKFIQHFFIMASHRYVNHMWNMTQLFYLLLPLQICRMLCWARREIKMMEYCNSSISLCACLYLTNTLPLRIWTNWHNFPIHIICNTLFFLFSAC
jgi:hypothetical protein